MSEDRIPYIPNAQLGPKKAFEIKFGAQTKFKIARPVVHRLSLQIATFPIIRTVLETVFVTFIAASTKASTAEGARFKSIMKE